MVIIASKPRGEGIVKEVSWSTPIQYDELIWKTCEELGSTPERVMTTVLGHYFSGKEEVPEKFHYSIDWEDFL